MDLKESSQYNQKSKSQKQLTSPKQVAAVVEKETKIEDRRNLPNKNKPILRFIGNVIFWLSFIAIFTVVLVFGVFGDGDIFGFYFFEVLTESMQSEIPRGSLVIVREVDPFDIEIDNDITFFINNEETATHRVIEIYNNYENSGLPAFRTMGIDNPTPDANLVRVDHIVGRVVGQISSYRSTLDWLSGNWWMVIIAAIVVFVIIFLLKIILKKEDDADDTVHVFLGPNLFQEESEEPQLEEELDNSNILVQSLFLNIENPTEKEKENK